MRSRSQSLPFRLQLREGSSRGSLAHHKDAPHPRHPLRTRKAENFTQPPSYSIPNNGPANSPRNNDTKFRLINVLQYT
jgi:hypothetical protein